MIQVYKNLYQTRWVAGSEGCFQGVHCVDNIGWMIQNMLLVVCHVVANKQQLHEINDFFSFLSWDRGLVSQACCKRWPPKGLNLLVGKAGSICLRPLKVIERMREWSPV